MKKNKLKSIIVTILMKIVAILLSIFLSTLAFETPQLCLFCKHCIPNNKFSKCSLFPKIKDNVVLLNKDNKPMYYYCHTARNMNDMCGIEGKLFES
uniref:Uncharacterized protein n=1 Tax=viral metagenome TaxID=1070528 RepID=A0A6C0B8R4_9ZZZZ